MPTAGSALHPDGQRFIFAQSVGAGDAEGGNAEEQLIVVHNFFEELKRLSPN